MIEIDVPEDKIEYAYGLAKQMQENRVQAFADVGLRAARARDPKMLKIMEKAAEYVTRLAENQNGRTRRSTANYGEKAEFTEVGLWREAYKAMDEGRAMYEFQWIYGAGAWLANLYIR